MSEKGRYTYAELESLVVEIINNASDWRVWSEAYAESKTNGTMNNGALSLANRYGEQLDQARDELLAFLKTVASDNPHEGANDE